MLVKGGASVGCSGATAGRSGGWRTVLQLRMYTCDYRRSVQWRDSTRPIIYREKYDFPFLEINFI